MAVPGIDIGAILQFCLALIVVGFLWIFFFTDDSGSALSLEELYNKLLQLLGKQPNTRKRKPEEEKELFPVTSSTRDDMVFPHPKELPPGPGHLTSEQVNEPQVHEHLTTLYKQYGPVYCFKVENSFVVVVNGYEAIQEVLVKKKLSFASRPVMPREIQYNPKQLGIFSAPYSSAWQAQRDFMTSAFHKIGAAGSRMEREILSECQHLTTALRATGEDIIDLEAYIPLALGNIMHFMLFGHRMDYKNDSYLGLFDNLYDFFEGPIITDENDEEEETLMDVVEKIHGYLRVKIQEHKHTLILDKPRDLVDLYLIQVHKDITKAPMDRMFTDESLSVMIFELLVTSLLPMINTLKWMCLYMTNNYDIQENVQAEIDKVLGPDQRPSMHSRKTLPYTLATIYECMRLSSVAALTPPHKSVMESRDEELLGYRIPAEAEVWINLWSVNHDPELWESPDLLRPSRFLNMSGHFVKRDKFMPYSAGLRMCPAMKAANMQLFLIFVSLMQNFRLERPPGVEYYQENGQYSDVLSAPDFTVLVLPR